MREIIFDTETTGLDPAQGHRVIEIGCVELIDGRETGQTYQAYLNPERPVDPDASAVSGLTDSFLRDQPIFSQIVDEFLAFIGQDRLVAHNAMFDWGFVNAELKRLGMDTLPASRMVDTLTLARQRFPGSPASLDALCRRFEIDLSGRGKHGALLDAQLLARVYRRLEQRDDQMNMMASLDGSQEGTDGRAPRSWTEMSHEAARSPRLHHPSAEEITAHETFLDQIKDTLWRKKAI